MKTMLLALITVAAARAAMTVRLEPSVPSPQPVGTVIALLPRVAMQMPLGPPPGGPPPGPPPGDHPHPPMLTYKYSVSVDGGPFRPVRDFSADPTFAWAPALYEQKAVVRVSVRTRLRKETVDADLPYEIVPRARAGSSVVITPTSNPLILLVSAPPCEEGKFFVGEFRLRGSESVSETQGVQCRAGVSNNVYVAGLRADSDYEVRPALGGGNDARPLGPWIPFHTGLLSGVFPPVTTYVKRDGPAPPQGIVIRSQFDPWRPSATDMEGKVVWYLDSKDNFLTRVLPGGRFLLLADGANSVNDIRRQQIVREVDLLGNSIRETNIGVLAEQLSARGIQSDCVKGGTECVPGFHHEAIELPNGHILAIAGIERIMPAGTQGSKEPVDVLGDLILDIDQDFHVAWYWNSFDHLDLKRASLGDEKCVIGPGTDGCSAVFLAPTANGWLHSNSLYFDSKSGDFIVSMPEQDWVLKIDYKNGAGSGKILWKLGKDGDFKVQSNDPYPWFSYQHDASYDPSTGLLVLFDDGHRRKDKFPEANNRGQAWKLDETNMTATPVINSDVGVYAIAVGSAQPLSGGNYSWESGFVAPGPAGVGAMFSQTTETSPDGKVVYAQRVEGGLTYRSFRVHDMYSVPAK